MYLRIKKYFSEPTKMQLIILIEIAGFWAIALVSWCVIYPFH